MADSSNGFLTLNHDLTYAAPEKIQDGDINFVGFKPQSIGIYKQNSTVDFKLRSTNEFVILDRSYMKFSIIETGAVAAAASGGTVLSSMGAQAVISQVNETISGLQLPVLRNYNLQQSVKLNTDTSERKAVTTITEAYGGAASGNNNKFAKRTFCIPVPTSLSTANKVIPLSVLNGGWNISLQLENYNRVFTNGAVGNEYEVTDLEIVLCMIKPDERYLSELASAMSRSGSLKIPLQLTKNLSTTLTNSSTQTVRVQCGFLSSLNSITNVIRKVSDVGTATVSSIKDTFLTNTAELKDYYFMINSQRYPKNKSITVADPENLIQLLAAFNTGYSQISPFSATTAFTHFSFESNGNFASGIPINDGYISIECSFTTSPTAGDIIDTFLEYSAVLVIDQNTVSLVIDV